MNTFLRPMLVAAAMLCIISCKKKDGDQSNTHTPGGPWCQMISSVKISNGCTDSTAIDNPYKIARLLDFYNCSSGNQTVRAKSFVYDGNKIFIVDTNNFIGTDTLIVDDQLRIFEAHGSRTMGNIIVRYEYDASGLPVRSITSQFGSPGTITQYTFSGGDLIMTASQDGDTVRYTYYADKAVPESGYLTQQGVGYGSAYTYRNAHLIKSVSDGRDNFAYSYSFDSYGNIDTMIATGISGTAYSDTTRYHYACAIE